MELEIQEIRVKVPKSDFERWKSAYSAFFQAKPVHADVISALCNRASSAMMAHKNEIDAMLDERIVTN